MDTDRDLPGGPGRPTAAPTNPDRARLIDALRMIERLREALRDQRAEADQPIAMVGMACRMPGGADDPAGFWRLLRDGVDATSEFPADRADASALFDADPEAPGKAYVTRGGFLGRIDSFEPAAFGIAPREAIGMDPQQRLTLQVAWEALEYAGYAPDSLGGSATGVFLGVSTTDYVRLRQQIGDPRDVDAYQLIGEPSFMAGRISYTLGLRGPSKVVDTACSSSLVALHDACQALRAGECDMALAGGVNLMLTPYGFLLMSKFRALSADGRCKTFDAAADGYGRGEGAGIVVLKRLADALESGDTVLAVVRGSAVNHDGRSSGMTVPNPVSQQAVITAALRQAGVAPADVDYVEAHGTGTSLGDPIELNALHAVLGRHRPPEHPLLVGSVKTNIGHLESAAGVAGLLKLVLALRHERIPAHLHLREPNPNVPWDRLHVEVPTESRPWLPNGRPRIGAVSSFGASGTNAHAVVAAAEPAPAGERPRRGTNMLTISARDEDTLRELAGRYAAELTTRAPEELADICYTTHVGRTRMPYGLAVAGTSVTELADGLRTHVDGVGDDSVLTVPLAPHRRRKVIWLFTGQGAQYPGMGTELLAEPAYRAAFDEVADLMRPWLRQPLRDLVATGGGGELDHTGVTQPALFALEYALAQLWLSWGLRPAAVLGHSLGEIVAACVAGVLELSDAVRLVAERAALMQALPPGGAMATLVCDERRAAAAIAGHAATVSLAAVNGPADTVIAGPAQDLAEITEALAADGVKHRLLRVSHAFHSPLITPALAGLGRVAAGITHKPPEIPIISNVTGRPWGAAEADPRYWVRHAASAVRFQDGVEFLHREGHRTFLEIGPQPVLLGLGSRGLDDPDCVWVPSLRRGHSDRRRVVLALGALHLRGVAVDWPAFHRPEQVRRTPLPTSRWRGEPYWFPVRPGSGPAAVADEGEPVAGVGRRLAGAVPGYQVDLPAPAQDEQADRTWPVPGRDELVRIAGRAAADGIGGGWPGVRNLLDGVPLVGGPDRRLRLVLTPRADGGSVAFAYLSATPAEQASGAPARAHLSGVLTRRQVDPDTTVDPATVVGTDPAVGAGAAGGQPWADPAELLMTMRWDPAGPAVPEDLTGTGILLFADRAGTAAALAVELDRRGAVCTVESSPPLPAGDPADRVASCAAGVGAVIDRWYAGGAAPGWILLAAGVDSPDSGDADSCRLTARRDDTELVALAVLQAVLARPACRRVRIALLTRAAVDTGEGQGGHDPFGAGLWGIGRVLALEHPEHWGGAVDLDPGGVDEPARIAEALATLGHEDQQALRGATRLVARVGPTAPAPAELRAEVAVRPSGSYLITGAFGGIGRSVARWLAERGAGRLVLVGRSGVPNPDGWDDADLPDAVRERIAVVRELTAAGAEVVVHALDVADADAVAGLVAATSGGRYPLRGVVHAAGVSVPQFARDARAPEYDQVWRPKVLGGWALHRATTDLPLDFFLSFSSIAATWGSQHLASYAAANAFLDGLAAYRHSLGLPALTVAWSSWELPSALFGDDVVEFLTATGLRLLSAQQCLRFIGALLAGGRWQQIVCSADWPRYAAVMQARAERPVFRGLEATVAAPDDSAGPSRLLAAIRSADPERATEPIEGYLRDQLAQILRLDRPALDGEFHLLELGLDSLMVMELISRVRKDLRITVSSPEFFACDANDWAAYLLRLVRDQHE
jgi:acyl transferase domain-containing protein/NADP-dependent 3-hydroxy acid dehydrogenase YdfG/acyl carrier protein